MPATLLCLLLVLTAAMPIAAQERTLTPEQIEALEREGELTQPEAERPSRLPDLTKGDPIGERFPQHEWPLGPTGMFGYMNGGPQGDQIEVTQVQPGSPAQGVLQWGDVIIGVGDKKFVTGQHMGMALGKAIIEAEREANNGELKLLVWRDKNFLARNGKKNIAGKDVDELIDKAASDDTLYDWVAQEQREQVVRSSNFDEFPIDSEVMQVTLKLEVMPDYSDTSPYDCPKARRILENAWKVLEGQFDAGKVRANRRGTIAALALVASGKPEHRELVRDWVRSPSAKAWHPSMQGTLDIMKPGGFVSWRMSMDALDCAVYYHATGDEFVLPAIREYAIYTAKGQAGGGSWGHTFAWPTFNGGQLHGMNPGYGALNAAGNRCFMLVALAKHLGIEHPEIDLAIERSAKFFGSYYEKGAVPYGHHGAAASDDSNGKNVGVAFAFKLMGDTKRAKWFAQMSSHASFTRRGGHGSGYFWHYSPLAATMLGPKATIATHRNLRWRFTLCRQFDGSFTLHSNYGKENLRNPTATYVLHYSAPMKQTLWTGKDVDASMQWTDDEFADLLTIAQGQFNDPALLAKAGPPVSERSTDEVFEYLGVFKPKMRRIVADELAKRYQAGEKDILPRLATLLDSDNPRLRGAACRALEACGPDATLQYMSGVAKLLNDQEEFVRMRAVSTIAKATQAAALQAQVLKSTVSHAKSETMSPNSVPSLTQGALFIEGSKLASDPFGAGIDEELVRDALEKLITLDPAGNRPLMGNRNISWDKETVARLAGPLVYAAEQEQIADQMFSSRRPNTLKFLEKHGYRESIDASASYLRRYLAIPRHLRARVYFKRGQVVAQNLMAKPGHAKPYLDGMYLWLADKPLDNAFAGNKEAPPIKLYELIDAIEEADPMTPLPSIADDAKRVFDAHLAALADDRERLARCRHYLEDVTGRDTFRKMNAMAYLVQAQQLRAIADVLPYLGHEDWRLDEHARSLAARIVAAHGDQALLDAFATAQSTQARAILSVLAEARTGGAKPLAEDALTNKAPAIRAAAANAMIALGGEAALPEVLDAMGKESHRDALMGYEQAVLSLVGSASAAATIRDRSIAMLDDASPPLRDTLYWLIAKVPGEASMAVLEKGLSQSRGDTFAVVVNALSYSPDPAADKLILDALRASLKDPRDRSLSDRVQILADEGVRRMVMSPEGPGKRPIQEQLDYAEAVLKLTLNDDTIAYLGRIKTGRCAYILQDAMRRGAPSSAAMAIVEATDDLSKATDTDRKYAESALVDVIEYIEVTYLRGGAVERLDKNPEAWRTYARWKTVSAEAGKNLLKLARPEKEPIPEFDDSDLDF